MFWETSNIMIIYNPLYHNMSVTGVKQIFKDKKPPGEGQASTYESVCKNVIFT